MCDSTSCAVFFLNHEMRCVVHHSGMVSSYDVASQSFPRGLVNDLAFNNAVAEDNAVFAREMFVAYIYMI